LTGTCSHNRRSYVTLDPYTVALLKCSLYTPASMSDAIEGADAILCGVSLAYKESSNCRLECQYAMQQKHLLLVPLMMDADCE